MFNEALDLSPHEMSPQGLPQMHSSIHVIYHQLMSGKPHSLKYTIQDCYVLHKKIFYMLKFYNLEHKKIDDLDQMEE